MQKKLIAVLLVSMSLSTHAYANYIDELGIRATPEIKSYASLYKNISASDNRQSLEKLFRLGENAKGSFYTSIDEGAVREKIYTTERFDEFEHEMAALVPGYSISASGDYGMIYFNPDPEQFLALAKKHGDDEDIKFFTLYEKIFPSGAELQQPGGCELPKEDASDNKTLLQKFVQSSKSRFYAAQAKKYLSFFEKCKIDK